MRRRISWRWLGALGLAALLASLAANVYLARQADAYYRDLYAARLDPLGLSAFAAERGQPLPGDGPVVVFYGDSRAAMWPVPEGLVSVQIVNRGVSNQTTAQVLARYDADIAPLTPQVIVLQAGINDLKTLPLFPEQADAIPVDCLANMQALVARATADGAQVIVTTIFPTGPVPLLRRAYWSPAVAEAVQRVNAELAGLAGPQVTVLDAYSLLVDSVGNLQADYALDTLHLTPVGYATLNAALTPLLQTAFAATP